MQIPLEDLLKSAEKSGLEAIQRRLAAGLTVSGLDEAGQIVRTKIAARTQQALVDRERKAHHLRLIGLLKGKRTRDVVLSRAWGEVRRWKRRRLCSPDNIREWSRLLSGPMPVLLDALAEDSADGIHRRQNSPFWLVLVRVSPPK
jgi:hypothetical protein